MNTQPHAIRRQPKLGDLLDLAQQLSDDSGVTNTRLRHRDRKIGRELTAPQKRGAPQLLGWLHHIRQLNRDLHGDRVDVLHRLGLLTLGVAGLLVGWGAVAVVFHYDGNHPVNVIHALAVFVLLQLLALLGFGLGLLPGSITRFLPGMRTLQEAIGLLGPGKLLRFLDRYLPQSNRESAAALLGSGRTHYRLYGRVDRWIVVHASQIFALMFNLGAVASAFYLVVFSDLAFSWSTTLRLEPEDLQRWTNALSAPWSVFLVDAQPSLELIQSTRYYRLKEGLFTDASGPAALGGWWPFLVMCMTVYGLVPRILTWLFARYQLGTALHRSFAGFPGTTELFYRLSSELVETRAEAPEPEQTVHQPGERLREVSLTGQSGLVINWAAAAADPDHLRAWAAEVAEVTVASWYEAGGTRSMEQDRQLVQQVATAGDRDSSDAEPPNESSSHAASLLILVKAWEPPMKDFLDFLRELRAALPEDRAVHVAPLGRSSEGQVTVAEPRHLDLWQSVLARQGDPWLSLSRLGKESP